MNADVRENEGSLKSIEQMANIGIIYGWVKTNLEKKLPLASEQTK